MVESTEKNLNLNLLDFGIVGDNLSLSELLHSSYVRGKKDLQKEIASDFEKNLQSAAQSSSLLKSKLLEIDIQVQEMYLKIINFNEFKCLIILNRADFYSKEKRWNSYKISDQINNTNSRIELTFSFIASSESIETDNIVSDGFIFKYAAEKV